MADPTLTRNLTILLGDGEVSETFGWPCGANVRSATFTNNTGEDVVLDCTDPTGEAAAIARWVESQDTQISISGRLATEAIAMWRGWADTGDAKNIRIMIDEAAADGGGYWALSAILQSFEIGAENKATATFTASIVGASRRTWTDAAA